MSTHNGYTTYHALGKLNALEKEPTIRKGGNLKTGGYGQKAPTDSNYLIQ
jgi:hypothetical protein